MSILNSIKYRKLFSLCREASYNNQHIRDDSRQVQKGDIFIAIRGIHNDGHFFIKDAIRNGAQVLVVENKKDIPLDFKGTYFISAHTRKLQSILLNHYYDFPSEKMFCIGITGTNGKTTVSYMLETILHQGGWKVGVVGTTGYRINGCQKDSLLTTPKPVDLQEQLSSFYKEKAHSAVMEVSSIGLEQDRVDNIDFNVAIFTNLARDHLDYHGTLDNYYKSKKNFFEIIRNSNTNHCLVILNTDDEYSYGCKKTCRLPVLTYGSNGEDLSYSITKETLEGTFFTISYKKNSYDAYLPMLGVHNVSNAACALLAASAAGFPVEKSYLALKNFQGVPGRLQRVPSATLHVFIDYAHTPDGLASSLKSLKKLKTSQQKLIVVFGCGGDRDKGKRQMMGQVADIYSDLIIVTSDNPRTESPSEIIKDIVTGIQSNTKIHVHEDRREAIKQAFFFAGPQDIILIAGKGHESVQIIKDQRLPFNDYIVATELLDK